MDAAQGACTLRPIRVGVIVCDLALRLQGAEQDEEIAEVLRFCGSSPLQKVIEEMEGIAGIRNAS